MTQAILKTIFAILIFGLVITGLTVVFADGADNYNIASSDKFNATLNRINETINITRAANNAMFTSGEQTGSTSEDSIIKGSFTGLKLMWRSYDLADAILKELSIAFGVPGWIIATFSAMILLWIGVSVLLLVFGRT